MIGLSDGLVMQMSKEKEIVCVHCDMLVVDKVDLHENLPFHRDCWKKWKRLNFFRQQIRIQLYKLAREASLEDPSYYGGIDNAETEVLKVLNRIKKEFPTVPVICISERTTLTEYRLIYEKLIQPFLLELRQFKKKWFGDANV